MYFSLESDAWSVAHKIESQQSDWEASSDEGEKPKTTATVAPPKKKGTLKQKLAEKAALKAERDDDDEYDSDAVLDPREKARRDKERELNADLNNAAELLGAAALGGVCYIPSMLLCTDVRLTACQARLQRSSIRSSHRSHERKRTSSIWRTRLHRS